MTLRIEPATLARANAELRAGHRRRAARSARAIATRGTEEQVRELVHLLATYIDELGDVHPNRRPTKEEEAEQAALDGRLAQHFADEMRRASAARELRVLLIARDVVDGRKIGPNTLADLLHFLGYGIEGEPEGLTIDELHGQRATLFADPAAAAELLGYLKPLCEAQLRAWRLHNKRRQGGPSLFRAVVAEKYGVEERTLKEVTVKTSE